MTWLSEMCMRNKGKRPRYLFLKICNFDVNYKKIVKGATKWMRPRPHEWGHFWIRIFLISFNSDSCRWGLKPLWRALSKRCSFGEWNHWFCLGLGPLHIKIINRFKNIRILVDRAWMNKWMKEGMNEWMKLYQYSFKGPIFTPIRVIPLALPLRRQNPKLTENKIMLFVMMVSCVTSWCNVRLIMLFLFQYTTLSQNSLYSRIIVLACLVLLLKMSLQRM